MNLNPFCKRMSQRFLSLMLVLVSVGCSPSAFFGNGTDQSILDMKNYRKINTACADMNLATSTIDVPTFRSIVKCFNANGSIDPVDKLINGGNDPSKGLTDAELAPIVDVSNRYILSNKKRLYEIERTHNALKDSGILDSSFNQLGKLLKNEDFVASSLALLKNGFFDKSPNSNSGQDAGHLDEKILKVIALISSKLDRDNVERAFNFGISVSGARAFTDLQHDFKDDSIRDHEKGPAQEDLEQLTEELFTYFKTDHTYSCTDDDASGKNTIPVKMSRELISTLDPELLSPQDKSAFDEFVKESQGYVDPSKLRMTLFDVVDTLVGTTPDSVKANIPGLAAVLDQTLTPADPSSPVLISRLSDAFRDLSTPIACMKGGESIPNAALHMVREIARLNPINATEYVLKNNLLDLMTLGPVCTYPTQAPHDIQTHYKTLIQMAKQGVMGQMTHVVKALDGPVRRWNGCSNQLRAKTAEQKFYHPLTPLLINFMGDAGGASLPGVGGETRQGFELLLPTMIELNRRDAWRDLLLVASLPKGKNRESFQDTLRFVLEAKPELDGESIYDVISRALSRKDGARPGKDYWHLYQFAKSTSLYFNGQDYPDGFLNSCLVVLRNALYVNDVHPFLNLVKEVMNDSAKNADFFRTVLLISDHAEFRDVIRMVSQMGQDGRLKELMSAVVSIFHKFASEAASEVAVHPDTPPPLDIANVHDLSKFQLNPPGLTPVDPNHTPPWFTRDCLELDLTFSLDQTSDPRFQEQLTHMLKCQAGGNSGGDPIGLTQAVEFLNTTPLPSSPKESYLAYLIRVNKEMFNGASVAGGLRWVMLPSDLTTLTRHWLSSMADGRFFRILNGITFFINDQHGVRDEFGLNSNSVVRPLFDVAGGIMTRAKPDVRDLQAYLAGIMESGVKGKGNFPALMADMEDLLKPDNEPEAPVTDERERTNAHVAKMEQWLYKMDPDFYHNNKIAPFERIKNWVRAKECDFHQDEKEVTARAEEIVNEAWDNVNNWEWVHDSAGGLGHAKKDYTLQEVKDRADIPMLWRLGNKDGSVPNRWLLDAFLNFLQSFSKPSDETPVKPKLLTNGNRNSVMNRYTPEFLRQWFYERSTDYRLITFYYDGETTPRVRLVNTLDLFELVLLSTDLDTPALFVGPKPRRMSLDFLMEIADAWGDLPRAEWPPEIQQKYPDPKNKPRTLLSAVRDIKDRKDMRLVKIIFPQSLNNLEDLTRYFVGVPKLPGCYKNGSVEGTPDLDKQGKLVGFEKFFHLLPADQIQLFQGHVYNIWQTNTVLEENAPDDPDLENGTNRGVGYAGGLEVLRDLFFEMYYSTPPEDQSFMSNLAEKNNLSLALTAVRLGNLHQIGRFLHEFEPETDQNGNIVPGKDGRAVPKDPGVTDLVYSLINATGMPGLRETMITLIANPQDPERKIIWRVMEQIFEVLSHADKDPKNDPLKMDVPRMKQLGFYLLADMNKIEPWNPGVYVNPSQTLLNSLLGSLNQIMTKNRDLILNPDADFLTDLAKSKLLSSFFRTTYDQIGRVDGRQERLKDVLTDFLAQAPQGQKSHVDNAMNILNSIYTDEKTRESWKAFRDRLDYVLNNPRSGYESVQFREAIEPILFFLEERMPGQTEEEKVIARKVRAFTVYLLREGKLDPFLELMRDNPNGFYQVLKTLSDYIGTGNDSKFKEFLDLAQRSLLEKPH